MPADGTVGAAARPESLVVLSADRRGDLGALVSPPPTADVARRAGRSALDAVLDEVRLGTRQARAAGRGNPLRYRVDLIEFFLTPTAP